MRRVASPAVTAAALVAALALTAGCGGTSDDRAAIEPGCGDLRFARATWVNLADPSRSARRRERARLLGCERTARSLS